MINYIFFNRNTSRSVDNFTILSNFFSDPDIENYNNMEPLFKRFSNVNMIFIIDQMTSTDFNPRKVELIKQLDLSYPVYCFFHKTSHNLRGQLGHQTAIRIILNDYRLTQILDHSNNDGMHYNYLLRMSEYIKEGNEKEFLKWAQSLEQKILENKN